MACDCYRIGGGFIGADPECPEHGYAAQAREREQDALESRVRSLEARLSRLETYLGFLGE